MTLEPAFSWIPALFCALLLTRAAVHKLAHWREFVAVVQNYHIVPARVAGIAAAIVTGCELSASLLLLPTTTRTSGALMAVFLFVSYAGAIALNLRRGRASIDCGCVAASNRRPIGAWMVWRNLALASATALAALPLSARALQTLDVLTIVAAVAALALLYAVFDQLASTSSRTGVAA